MSSQASALAFGRNDVRWGSSSFPFGTILLSVVACLIAPSGSFAVVALAVVWFPYLVMHPQAGLWFGPVLVMLASLLASPTGFIAGWGYSPQLMFWAVAISIAFAATGISLIIGTVLGVISGFFRGKTDTFISRLTDVVLSFGPPGAPARAGPLADTDARPAALMRFPPSARRAYCDWVAEAKRPETRAKRAADALAWMREGKRRHWKYENC